MKTKYTFLRSFCCLLLISFTCTVMAQVPDKPNPPKLVNDFAGILSMHEIQVMEDSLQAFSKKTSNQIVVVTLNDFGGMDKAQLAFEIGEKWGVGNQKFNNGIVILIKPKNSTRGEAFIATGYGLEGALPDAACKSIIESEMIPPFKKNNYFAGISNALSVIMPIAAGEITFADYKDKQDQESMILAFILFIVIMIVVIILAYSNKGKDSGTMGSGGSMMAAGFFLGGGGRSSGSFGGGSGGFGGFGGGSFGGGGAGGSW
ncbi:MAG: TPM domain-containing protein [Muribaculaceae bacterium]